MVERRGVYRVLLKKSEERDHLGDPGVDGKIILRWIFEKWDVGVWTGLSWLRTGTVAGTCEYGNEPPGSIKRGGFLD
jgi:hypothetical protein